MIVERVKARDKAWNKDFAFGVIGIETYRRPFTEGQVRLDDD